MGFGTITTHLILFIAVIAITAGVLVGIKNFTDQSESTFNTKNDDLNNRIATDIKIEVIHYNNITNTTSIYVKNTGNTKMRPEQIDIYLDSQRIPRNSTNRTIEVLSDTELNDIGVWNPKEELKVVVNLWLNENITHEAIITTPYEVRDSETFSIN